MVLKPSSQLIRHLTSFLLNHDLLLIPDSVLVNSGSQQIFIQLFVLEINHIIYEHIGESDLVEQIFIVHSLQELMRFFIHLQLVPVSLGGELSGDLRASPQVFNQLLTLDLLKLLVGPQHEVASLKFLLRPVVHLFVQFQQPADRLNYRFLHIEEHLLDILLLGLFPVLVRNAIFKRLKEGFWDRPDNTLFVNDLLFQDLNSLLLSISEEKI